MAKEKNLTNITSVAAADFVRMVTSAGASVKATAANLAKYIIETYNGSTVAGSAQSVKSALDSLNSNLISPKGTQITNSTSLNNYYDIGKYYVASAADAETLSDCPTNKSFSMLVLWLSSSGRVQIIIPNNAEDSVYLRNRTAGGAFTAWRKITPVDV